MHPRVWRVGCSIECSSKLPQHAQIVLKEIPNVWNAVLNHGKALNAQAKRKPSSIGIFVVAAQLTNFFKHPRVHHAATAKLEPFCCARARIFPVHGKVGTGFGERIVTGLKTNFGFTAEQAFCHFCQRAFLIGKGDALTHHKSLELMEHGWSMKHLHKLMVMSNAYRMASSSSGAPPANRQADGDNRFLWHMNAGRMESQVVRDSLLYLGGQLDSTLGGPSVEIAQQEASNRRSLYFFHSAIDRNRFLTTFDEADALECYRRRESIVPQQALALANSKLALDMADKIADRLGKKLGDMADRSFADEAFLTVLARTPTIPELTACTLALTRWRELYVNLPPAEATRRARAHLVHALINHNDFVTIR